MRGGRANGDASDDPSASQPGEEERDSRKAGDLVGSRRAPKRGRVQTRCFWPKRVDISNVRGGTALATLVNR